MDYYYEISENAPKNNNYINSEKCYGIDEDVFSYTENDPFQPVEKQRNSANARERDRTQNVNSAFTTLRSLIPTEPKDRKLSKIEVLRLAVSYISHLTNRLLTGKDDQPCLQTNESDDKGSRNQVCTFCWSTKKEII